VLQDDTHLDAVRAQTADDEIHFRVCPKLICMSSVLGSVAGCDRRTDSEPATTQDQQPARAPPFLLAITADRTGITMAHSTRHNLELPRRDFNVLFSNVS